MAENTIYDWGSYFGARSLVAHAAKHPNGMRDRTGPAEGVGTVKAVARVSASCWIVDCPAPACSGAEFANFDEPLFFCCQCRNAAWGHKPLPVDLPAVKQRAEIEAVLLKRPAELRHWLPGETAAHLKAENILIGADA